jgi:hypothetical protein
MTPLSRSILAAILIGIVVVGTVFIVSWPKGSSRVPVSSTPAGQSLVQEMSASDYDKRVQRITALLENAPTYKPSPSDSEWLMDQAQHHSDFRIRVRAMAVLPFIEDREKAIEVLIACVHDRESESSGGRNVPLYATRYLADMSAARAIPDIEDWIAYLQEKPPDDEGMRAGMLKSAREHLHRLKRNVTTQPVSAR